MNLLPFCLILSSVCGGGGLRRNVKSKKSGVYICRLFCNLLGFSQTCHVSAGLTKACPRALSRISVFSSSQHFSSFYFPSVEVILDMLTGACSLLLTVRNLAVQGSHGRAGGESEGSEIKGKQSEGGEGGRKRSS